MPDPKPLLEQRKTAPMMIRAAETRPSSYQEADNSIEVVWSTGAAVTRFDWWDGEYYDEVLSMDEGAVRLGRMNAGAPALNTHDMYDLDAVIGSVVPGSARIEDGIGICRISLSTTPDVADIVQKIKDGHIRNVSVGYQVYTYEISEPGEGKRTVMTATDWEPWEVSFVPVPADPDAQVRARSAAQGGGNPCIIRGAAASKEKTTMPDRSIEPAPAAAPDVSTQRQADPAPAPSPTPAPAPEPEQRTGKPVTAKTIRAMCARSADLGDEFALQLIEENEESPMSEADLHRKVNERLFEKRKQPSIDARAGVTGTETQGYRQAVEDAVTLRANPDANIEDIAGGPTKDQRLANAREFRGMTLMELARDNLQRTGMSASGLGRMELAGAALGMRYGAMTTSDFAVALAAASNKRVRAAFAAAPQTFRPIVSVGTLPDFKPTNIVGLGDAPALLHVPENGEFKRGALTDTGLFYQLQTYGRIIAITRQAIVNDDMKLFGRIPTMFGRKAADLESDLVWGILTSNPDMGDGNALFSAAHGNLAAAGTAITVASLGAGRQAMREQTSDEGGYINIAPAFLIVGPAKEVEAQQMLAAITANASNAVNPFAGSLTLIVEPRITGNQWFLSASPDAFDTIELAHLLGQEELFTETRVGFDVDGVENKARLDVGGAAIDWRGFYKNPGN
jgi:HK97 family phage prohead protease